MAENQTNMVVFLIMGFNIEWQKGNEPRNFLIKIDQFYFKNQASIWRTGLFDTCLSLPELEMFWEDSLDLALFLIFLGLAIS